MYYYFLNENSNITYPGISISNKLNPLLSCVWCECEGKFRNTLPRVVKKINELLVS